MITQQRVSEILLDVWDPIGVKHDVPATADEYRNYVPQVHEILCNAADDDEAISQIASYLTWSRLRTIGLSHIDGCNRDAKAAVALVKEGRRS